MSDTDIEEFTEEMRCKVEGVIKEFLNLSNFTSVSVGIC